MKRIDHQIRQLEKTSRATGWLLATLALLIALGLIALVGSCSWWAQEPAPVATPSEADSDVTHLTNLYVESDFQVGANTQFDGNVDVNGQELILDADADSSITADTDDQIDLQINSQDVISITGSAFYSTLDLYYQTPSLIKTADYAATIQDSGATFNNAGASGEITITLPAAVPGLRYCFYVYAAQAITIDPDDADTIHHLTNAAGDRLQNSGTAGDNICLFSSGSVYWLPLGEVGTWSDAN